MGGLSLSLCRSAEFPPPSSAADKLQKLQSCVLSEREREREREHLIDIFGHIYIYIIDRVRGGLFKVDRERIVRSGSETTSNEKRKEESREREREFN
jgi:hypothetical protein